MLIRRVAAPSITAVHHLRCFSTAALLQEFETPQEFTYLEGFPRPDPKYDEIINAIPRAISGKNISAKERKAGRVPSIVFEAEDGQHGGNKRLISVQTNQIKKLVNHMGRSLFLSRVFDLEVRPEFESDDTVEKVRVLPRKKWKISCFRHDELSFETPNPEPADELLHESETEEINKPSIEIRNWAVSPREVVDALFRVVGKPWTVPWTAQTILQVTLLWIISFWFVGSWMIPFGAHIVGFSRESLTFRGQALFSLLTDVTEGLAGILILVRCLSRFRPLPSDWFKFSLKGNWPVDVLLGCLMFPLVNRLSQFNLDLLPVLPFTPVSLSSVEQSIMSRDPIAMALYALVLVVCAPLWEEIVFRGFLLPSLTKYMPVWCSILVSSIAFALAHFNVQRMLPLIFLGVVMGVTYSRSRNLLPSMLLHSLWNGFVFLDLMK